MSQEADDVKVARLRQLLPATGAGIYLDTATRGPLPAETAAAMRDADDWELRVGRATEGREEDFAQRVEEARAVLAALVVGDPADIILTCGIGHALTTAAWTPDWRPGDRILTAASPGPELSAAAHSVARRFELRIDVVDDATPVAMASAISDKTRLVMLPHVDPNTGDLLPVAEISDAVRPSGAWLAIDASLSAGAVPVDVTTLGADVVALAADRWLLGPEETGALWIGSRARAAGLADWPEFGINRTAVLGLARSVGWLEMYVGLGWAYERGRSLAHRLRAALARVPGIDLPMPQSMATVVCFRLPAWSTDQVLEELRRRVFAIIGPTPQGDAIRASVAWFNTDDEIDRFAAAVLELARHTPDTLPRRPPLVVR